MNPFLPVLTEAECLDGDGGTEVGTIETDYQRQFREPVGRVRAGSKVVEARGGCGLEGSKEESALSQRDSLPYFT